MFAEFVRIINILLAMQVVITVAALFVVSVILLVSKKPNTRFARNTQKISVAE